MSDFGTPPQGFKTKGRKNKQKKTKRRNGGQNYTRHRCGVRHGVCRKSSISGYQQSQEPKFIVNEAAMDNPGITSVSRQPTVSAYGPQPQKPIPRGVWGRDHNIKPF